MIIYGVRDKKAERYVFMFDAENDDLARRVVYRMLERGNNDFVKFPDDFAVYKLGKFNDSTGFIYNFNQKDIAFEMISLFRAPSDTTDPVDPVASEGVADEGGSNDGIS